MLAATIGRLYSPFASVAKQRSFREGGVTMAKTRHDAGPTKRIHLGSDGVLRWDELLVVEDGRGGDVSVCGGEVCVSAGAAAPPLAVPADDVLRAELGEVEGAAVDT